MQTSCGMGRARLSLVLCLAFMVSAMAVVAKEDRINKTTPGLFWSTGKEEAELFRKSDAEETVALNGNDELDGGFSSLDGMLQWAIGTAFYDLAQFIQIILFLLSWVSWRICPEVFMMNCVLATESVW